MMNDISIPFETTPIPTYYTVPDMGEKHSAVILIHEVWGVNDHIKSIADRLQKQGYVVLAPDLFFGMDITEKLSPQLLQAMQNPATKEEAQKKMREALVPTHAPDFAEKIIAKLQACFDYLQKQVRVSGKIGVIGFSFGGTYSFSLAVAQPKLKAAISFSGHAPQPLEKVKDSMCPILAFYGEKDTQLVAEITDLNDAMGLFHKPFEAVIYPDCDHAFFNDTNPTTYYKEAAEDAWERVIEFLKINL